MINNGAYCVFRNSLEYGHKEVVYYLLNYPDCFAWVDTHYSAPLFEKSWLRPFVAQKLEDFKAQQTAHNQTHPEEIFNLDREQECRLGFYMLRYLISRQSNFFDEIRFLVSIPGINALFSKEASVARLARQR